MNFTKEIVKKVLPYMRHNGFSCSGRHFSKVINDLAFCVSVDMPSGIVYVTAYVVPLYVPCAYRYYTYGNRLNHVEEIRLPLLAKTDDSAKIDQWCRLLCKNIDQKIIPFFTKVDSPQKLVEYLDNTGHSFTSYIFCPDADIWRLKIFTYLYLDEHERLRYAANRYCEEINKMPYTDNVMKERMEEVEEVLCLLDCKDTATAYRFSAIENTRNILR